MVDGVLAELTSFQERACEGPKFLRMVLGEGEGGRENLFGVSVREFY